MPGFSGSPVFIYRTGRIDMLSTYTPAGPNVARLLGVDFCHLPNFGKLGSFKGGKFERYGDLWVEQSSGLMGVIPAWKLHDLLFEKDLLTKRKEANDERRRQKKDAAPGSFEPVRESAPRENEFERFENLARKLINTPKPKPDESGETS